jgi:hypothetical protein
MVVELACIGTQAGRGDESHFNYATPFDRAVFTIMGLGTFVANEVHQVSAPRAHRRTARATRLHQAP